MVFLAVLGWWLFSGNGPQGPAGNDPRYLIPESEATAPTAAGAAAEGSSAGPVSSLLVPIDSVVVESDQRVALNYTIGPASCVGVVQTPRVLETDAAVTVTLARVPPIRTSERCEDTPLPEVRGTIRVTLDTTLEGRALLDGAYAAQRRVPRATRAYESD